MRKTRTHQESLELVRRADDLTKTGMTRMQACKTVGIAPSSYYANSEIIKAERAAGTLKQLPMDNKGLSKKAKKHKVIDLKAELAKVPEKNSFKMMLIVGEPADVMRVMREFNS